jgi:hypothetical protein
MREMKSAVCSSSDSWSIAVWASVSSAPIC